MLEHIIWINMAILILCSGHKTQVWDLRREFCTLHKHLAETLGSRDILRQSLKSLKPILFPSQVLFDSWKVILCRSALPRQHLITQLEDGEALLCSAEKQRNGHIVQCGHSISSLNSAHIHPLQHCGAPGMSLP